MLQLVVHALVPLSHTRPDRSADVAFERAHSSQCLILHAPDRCVLCQWAGSRARPAAPSTVPAAVVRRSVPAVRAEPQSPESHTSPLHASRAPPVAA